MSKRRASRPATVEPTLEALREDSAAFVLGNEYDGLGELALKGLVEQRQGSGVTAPVAVDADSDPRDNETWSFQFEWTDSRGKRYAGKFTNRILSLGLLQRVAAAQSVMQQGQPVESFAPGMLVVNNAIAHMMFSLVERPGWAKDITALTSVELVMELWGRVRSHEDRYFRAETATADSDDEDTD